MRPEERAQRLQLAMMAYAPHGQITPMGPYQFQIVTPGNRANNVLHAVLTLMTCGLWLIVWLIVLAAEKPPRRSFASIDEFGGVWVDGQLWWPSPGIERPPPGITG